MWLHFLMKWYYSNFLSDYPMKLKFECLNSDAMLIPKKSHFLVIKCVTNQTWVYTVYIAFESIFGVLYFLIISFVEIPFPTFLTHRLRKMAASCCQPQNAFHSRISKRSRKKSLIRVLFDVCT